MNIQNKVALVTGGGRGIGAKIAERLGAGGVRVAVCGTTLDVLQQKAAEIQSAGGAAMAVEADVVDEGQVAALFEKVNETWGPVEILVNNAGIAGPTAGVGVVALEDWQRTLDVNLTGAFLCARAAAPAMIEARWGKIINISSMAGKTAYPLRAPYAASKWGMIGLSHTLAKELGPKNIQVNTICPGPTAGDRMRRVIQARADQMGRPFEEVETEFVSGTALKRMATEDEVAALAIYLLSDEAAAVTGQAIDVAAGYGI